MFPCSLVKEGAVLDYLGSQNGRGGRVLDGTIPPFIGYLNLVDSTEIDFR